jgi:hypothetical protein
LKYSTTVTLFAVGATLVPVPDSDTVCGLPGAFDATVMLPLRAPAASGLNATVTLQFEPATTTPQVLPTIGNSDAELDSTLVIVADAVPVLLIVICVPAVCTPTADEPRFALAGTLSAGEPATVWPVPLTANDCGLPVPLLVTVIWPLRAPDAAGENWTLTVHDEPGFTVAPSVQVRLTIANSDGLLLVTVVIWAAAVPVLLIVFATTELDAPTLTVPKFAAAGIVSAGVPAPPVPPVPLTANDCGLPRPLLTIVICPLRAPVAAGVN